MVWPSSDLQASFQLTLCLAIPVADVPYVCHAASLAWMQEDEESTQYRPIERQEHAEQYIRVRLASKG